MLKPSIDSHGEDSSLIECQILKDNEIKPKETARFTITTENPSDIRGFTYNIQSDVNLIFASHLESIVGNKETIILNNLTNKLINFGVYYMAVF